MQLFFLGLLYWLMHLSKQRAYSVPLYREYEHLSLDIPIFYTQTRQQADIKRPWTFFIAA